MNPDDYDPDYYKSALFGNLKAIMQMDDYTKHLKQLMNPAYAPPSMPAPPVYYIEVGTPIIPVVRSPSAKESERASWFMISGVRLETISGAVANRTWKFRDPIEFRWGDSMQRTSSIYRFVPLVPSLEDAPFNKEVGFLVLDNQILLEDHY
jgi:hypothetical protein